MKKDYCHITAIIDRSGSMTGLENEVIGGFNSFLSDQKKVEGTATMSLIQFDNMYELNYEFVDIQDVKDLNHETYIPRGMTAMHDAIGKAIISTGTKLGELAEDDRPDKVIVLIQTDGEENSSHEFNVRTIKKMIEEQEKTYAWTFVFLGANINAKDTATNIGIDKKMSMSFAPNSKGMTSAYDSVSENLTQYRCGVKRDMSYEDKDYIAQSDAGAHQ